MNREKYAEWKYVYRWGCTIVLTALAAAMFFVAWYGFVEVNNRTQFLLGYGNLAMATIIYAVLYFVVGRWIHAFRIGVERGTNLGVSQGLTLGVADTAEVFISMAITNQWRYVFELIRLYSVLFLVQSIVLVFIVFLMVRLYRKLFPPIDILEIYGQRNDVYEKVNGLFYKYHISESVYASHYEPGELVEKIKQHQAVLINDLPSKQKNYLIKTCYDMDKRVYVVPKISDVILKSSEELNLLDTPMFLCRNREIQFWQRFVKRVMDIVLSFIAAVIISPILIVTAIMIHNEDGGPVFFRQERCTRGGKRFWMLKFRSMRVGTNSLRPTMDKDDRVTRVGKVIRAWRIDELPQLFNILKGDMSIVGPRPERVEHVEAYTKKIPEFKYRLKVKGGLTGYAQVYGKYNTSALDKLKLDLIYITNFSLKTDLQILFETVKILCLKESTEGFHTSGTLENIDLVRDEFARREK